MITVGLLYSICSLETNGGTSIERFLRQAYWIFIMALKVVLGLGCNYQMTEKRVSRRFPSFRPFKLMCGFTLRNNQIWCSYLSDTAPQLSSGLQLTARWLCFQHFIPPTQAIPNLVCILFVLSSFLVCFECITVVQVSNSLYCVNTSSHIHKM